MKIQKKKLYIYATVIFWRDSRVRGVDVLPSRARRWRPAAPRIPILFPHAGSSLPRFLVETVKYPACRPRCPLVFLPRLFHLSRDDDARPIDRNPWNHSASLPFPLQEDAASGRKGRARKKLIHDKVISYRLLVVSLFIVETPRVRAMLNRERT